MNFIRKTGICLLILLAFTGILFAQSFIQIGTGTTTTNMPIYTSWNYGWSKLLYNGSALNGPKTITQIALNQANMSTMVLNNQKVYIKHTSAQNLNGNLGYENPETSGFTLVYNGSFTSLNGWVIVDINDFSFNGTDNLLILWENRHGTESYSGPQFNASDIPAGTALVACLGGDNALPTGSGFEAYPRALPNMRFYYQSSAPGNPDNPVPVNNTTNIRPEIVLNWTFGSNTTNYDLYLGTSTSNMTMVVNNASVTNNNGSYDPANLQFNTQYYWKVVAKGSNQSLTEGPVWSFKTQPLMAQFPYTQNFDSYPGNMTGYELQQWLPEGWTKSNTDWSLRVEYGIDSTACMAAAFSHVGPTTLYSPRFNISAGYRVSFMWKDADAFKIAAHDTTYFEVTSNGGQSWTTLGALYSESSTNSPWHNLSLPLNGVSGNDVMFRWRDVSDNSVFAEGTRIDNFKVDAIPTQGEIHLSPLALNFPTTGVSSTSVLPLKIKNLNGTLQITGIQISAPFSATYSGTLSAGDSVMVDVTFNPQTVGNFNQNLTVLCSGDFQGNNIVALSGASSTALPSFLQTFESAVVPALPSGWTKIIQATNQYTDVYTATSSFDSHSPTNYVKLLNMSNESGATVMLVSPATTNFGSNQLKFWAKTQWPNARVQVGTLTNPADAGTFSPVAMVYPQAEYAEYTVNFTGINGIRNIAFKKITSDSLSSVYIDDISWQTANTTNPPQPTEVVSPQNNAVNVSLLPLLRWSMAAGNPTGYKLFVGTDNPPTNMINGTDMGTALQYQIDTELTYSTSYFWKVVPYNTNGDAVDCPVWQFTAMADPSVVSFPWTENFDSYPGMVTPLGWTVLNLNNDTATWKTISNPNNQDIAHSQPTALHCPFSFSTPQDDWIFTPPLQLNQDDSYKLTFYYHVLTAPEGVELPEKLEVKWGMAPTVEAMNTEPLFQDDSIDNLNYMQAEAEFIPLNNTTYYIGFHCTSDPMMWMLIIDDIKIENLTKNTDVLNPVVSLKQNYPNPFNPVTRIDFALKNNQKVSLKVYNAKGQLVKTLINGLTNQGNHSIIWNGEDNDGQKQASGVYFYRLETQEKTISKKMIMIK